VFQVLADDAQEDQLDAAEQQHDDQRGGLALTTATRA
jgi:hypothetical protein